ARLMIVVPLTIVLIFLVLYVAFRSVKWPIAILLNVAMAPIGGILALVLTGTHFSVSSGVGFLALSGVSVQTGVIMVEYINQLRARGLGVDEATIKGAVLRLRPIMMTALVATLGLLPAALSHDIGSDSQRPFALVIVGGLLTNLAISVFLLPTLYAVLAGPGDLAAVAPPPPAAAAPQEEPAPRPLRRRGVWAPNSRPAVNTSGQSWPCGHFWPRWGHGSAWWVPNLTRLQGRSDVASVLRCKPPTRFLQKGDRAMHRIGVFVYGVFSYLCFLATFLYAVGFVGGFGVPRSIDSPAEGPLATAVLVNVLLLAVFALQHSVMARPAFKRSW